MTQLAWTNRVTSNLLRCLTIISLVILLGFSFTSTKASSHNTSLSLLEWTEYTDDRFDFSLEIPSSWHVDYRADKPGAIGETLTFSNFNQVEEIYGGQRMIVTVGLYL